MALFFNRISKVSACRVNNARLFSSFPHSPCLLLRESPDGEIVKHKLFDPTTEKTVSSQEKKLPNVLLGQPLLGASQGWVASLHNIDLSVRLTDLYKPCVSSPRVLSLPPLEFRPSTNDTQVSLSSSSPVGEDFLVAAKFNENRLSVCRPNIDSKWTHLETPSSVLPASNLIYSKRDKAFYFTSFKGLYMGALDLINNALKYQELRLQNLPTIPEVGWLALDKCFMSTHLVESPSGELFFIKWYTQCIRSPYIHKEDKDEQYEMIHNITQRFMVFREDGKSIDFCYTQDIGDLCIFLGKSEAFCVSARMYPGLKPNSIYYIGPGLGSYDLASGTVHTYNPSDVSSSVSASFWLHPTNPIA